MGTRGKLGKLMADNEHRDGMAIEAWYDWNSTNNFLTLFHNVFLKQKSFLRDELERDLQKHIYKCYLVIEHTPIKIIKVLSREKSVALKVCDKFLANDVLPDYS